MKRRIVIIICSALALASLAFAQKRDAEERGVRSKSFSVSKGGKLDVSVRSGDIRVTPWSKNEVYVETEGIDEDDLDRLKMSQSGNTVRVEFRPRGGNWGWDGGLSFQINVPTDFNVDINTSGGDLEVTGALNGKIEGRTSGGNIKIDQVVGPVDMSTSGGNINVGDIKGDIHMSTSGGDIELRRVDGEADVKTSGGDIRVQSVSKKLEASTSGGDIEIGDVGGEAKVHTSGGDVKVGKVSGNARLSTSGGNVELKGASGTVTAKTSGGDIDLTNITGSVIAATSGGNIRAELIPSGKGTSEMKSSGGDIKLFLPENAKATIEAIIEVDERWGSKRRKKYEIRSDFKAETYDEGEDEIRATYILNGGGERISLETVNSQIEIKKLNK